VSNRTIRVNELIQRELGDILRRRYQSESVSITISAVQVTEDLREGRVFVSIIGNEDHVVKMFRWICHKSADIREELGRRIVLKYLPKFTYAIDESTAKGNKILALMDQLGLPELPSSEPNKPVPPSAS
jgi:ribosome-binding factor A